MHTFVLTLSTFLMINGAYLLYRWRPTERRNFNTYLLPALVSLGFGLWGYWLLIFEKIT